VRGRDSRRAISIAAVSLVSHLIAVAAGLRVSSASLSTYSLTLPWHLLPLPSLRHDLWSSLLHLHSQPPLFNLVTGILIRFNLPIQLILSNATLIAFSILLAVSAYFLMRELAVGRRTATLSVLVLIVADPAQLLYPSAFFYTVPTAALVTSLGWAAAYWVRTKRVSAGIAYGSIAAVLILTNSSYQIYVIALATVPLAYLLRREWRNVVKALCVPTLIVGLWYINDFAQFGTLTTSSWLGMNLARVTTMTDSPADLSLLVRQGVISSTSLIRPFSCLRQYGPLGVSAPTGIVALDQRDKIQCPPGLMGFAYGRPNYNNIAYIKISERYLSDDLKWIEHRPLTYVKHLVVGFKIWTMPAEQSSPFYTSSWKMSGYTALYDHVVELQISSDWNADYNTVFNNKPPGWNNISITNLLITILDILVLPIVIVLRRRRIPAGRTATAIWLWLTTAIFFITSTLVEIGENNRFRFELGALPIIAAVVALSWLANPGGDTVQYGPPQWDER